MALHEFCDSGVLETWPDPAASPNAQAAIDELIGLVMPNDPDDLPVLCYEPYRFRHLKERKERCVSDKDMKTKDLNDLVLGMGDIQFDADAWWVRVRLAVRELGVYGDLEVLTFHFGRARRWALKQRGPLVVAERQRSW